VYSHQNMQAMKNPAGDLQACNLSCKQCDKLSCIFSDSLRQAGLCVRVGGKHHRGRELCGCWSIWLFLQKNPLLMAQKRSCRASDPSLPTILPGTRYVAVLVAWKGRIRKRLWGKSSKKKKIYLGYKNTLCEAAWSQKVNT